MKENEKDIRNNPWLREINDAYISNDAKVRITEMTKGTPEENKYIEWGGILKNAKGENISDLLNEIEEKNRKQDNFKEFIEFLETEKLIFQIHMEAPITISNDKFSHYEMIIWQKEYINEIYEKAKEFYARKGSQK